MRKATTNPPKGGSKGIPAGRLLLAPFALLYGCGARLRARLWRSRARRLSKPVLSVGNLTFGGTGKTPFVIHACHALRRRGLEVCVLSRGYASHGAERNDEAEVIDGHLPGLLHLQDPNRFEAGLSVMKRVDAFVLDDGFQHLPLARDEDVVLIDATLPFGGGFCPPAGRLREPLAALARATCVILTRADQVSRESLGETMRVVRAKTRAPVATGVFAPSCESDLAGLDVLVACGIGNPAAFRSTVESLGAKPVECREFRDHHRYGERDVEALASAGLPVVVTEKDAVKLRPLWSDAVPLHVVRIEFEPTDGAAHIEAVFDRIANR